MIYKSFLAFTFSILVLFSCESTTQKEKTEQIYSAISNVKYNEYSPTISADGRTLVFQADLFKQGTYKIYLKYKLRRNWTEPKILKNVNSNYPDGGCFITYDQNYLIITSKRPGGYGGVDLWMSQRQGKTWSEPENIESPINSSGYDGFASLDPAGQNLYFVRDCPEKTKCKSDKLGIFVSHKIDSGWSVPVKLPPPINTEYCEFGPTILADGKTLIFSSTRPGGYGNYDLYKTVQMEDGSWEDPVNLGRLINTKYEDSLVTIPASGDVMYYTRISFKNKVKASRIVKVRLPYQLRHSIVVTLAGAISDSEDPEKKLGAKITIQNIFSKRSKAITIQSNKQDGEYIAILNMGKVYDISVTSSGYLFYSKIMDLRNLTSFKSIIEDIKLKKIKIGSKIVLNNLYFKYRSYKLLNKSKYELLRVIKVLKDNPSIRMEISGHTDNVGSKKYNQKLSKQRAGSVVSYLIEKGISKIRLVGRGYGERKPLVSNKTKELRKKNRRVELKVLHVDIQI